MYKIEVSSKKVDKKLRNYISMRNDIVEKLERLKIDPRRANGAHSLHGKLSGKWACWLGYNIRIIYIVNDLNKIISVDSVGTHKIY